MLGLPCATFCALTGHEGGSTLQVTGLTHAPSPRLASLRARLLPSEAAPRELADPATLVPS